MALLKSSENVRAFFAKELKTAMASQHLAVQEEAQVYLVGLMMDFIEADKFFAKDENGKRQENVLVDLYSEYIHGNKEQKKAALKRLGDICMMVTGFFSDSLNRKLVDIDYYFGMGGTAYWQLSHFRNNEKETFQELSKKFRPISNVLGQISESVGVTSNTDLLRIYERWHVTGSDRLRDLLTKHGIQTVEVDLKTKQ